jgi:hypothetical protein
LFFSWYSPIDTGFFFKDYIRIGTDISSIVRRFFSGKFYLIPDIVVKVQANCHQVPACTSSKNHQIPTMSSQRALMQQFPGQIWLLLHGLPGLFRNAAFTTKKKLREHHISDLQCSQTNTAIGGERGGGNDRYA